MHPDHHKYYGFTPLSRLDKSLKTLSGIVEGIAIDNVLNKKEMAYLKKWINEHDIVRYQHPFNELFPVVEEAISDHVLTDDEKRDIVWLCEHLSSQDIYYDHVTHDIQRLHGVLGGIIADGKITTGETKGLSEWLTEHDHLKECWPYDEIDAIVTHVLADGAVDDDEKQVLMAFFTEFATGKTITNPGALKDKTITGVCAVCPEIEFDNRKFCFTGGSVRYRRKTLKEIVEQHGGIFINSVSRNLDYLIIGADGNPCWAYACYGRKVETAVDLRKQGIRVLLVHENDFHDAVEDHMG